MQTRITLLSLLAASVLALPAQAESVSSGGLPDYARVELNYATEGNFDLTHFGGVADFRAGALDLTLGGHHYSGNGPGDLYGLSAKVAYRFGNGFAAFGEAHHFGFSGLGGSETLLGLGVDYQNEVFGIGATYLTDDDVDIYHLAGFYRFGPKFRTGGVTGLFSASFVDGDSAVSLGADYQDERFGATAVTTFYDGPSNGVTALGLRGYPMPRLHLGANVITSNDDFLSDGIYSIDVGYEVADNLRLGGFYASGFGNGVNSDIFGLNLVWELGHDRARVFDSVDMYMRNAVGPIRHLWPSDVFAPIYGPGALGGF